MPIPFVPKYWPEVIEWCRKIAESLNYVYDSSGMKEALDANRTVVSTGATSSVNVIWQGTAAEYGALTPNADTLYITTDGTPHIYVGSTTIL